jgi:hypothetical protein
MKKSKLFFLFVLLSLVTWWRPAETKAQSSLRLVVHYAEPVKPESEETEGDGLTLRLYFSIVDEEGNAVAIQPQSATVIWESGPRYPADLSQASTPFFISLVFDGGGSVAGPMSEIVTAAQEAIRNAPAQANFAVSQFDQRMIPLEDFTANHTLVLTALGQLTTGAEEGSCLYDAALAALQQVQLAARGVQGSRRAVVLFATGLDEDSPGTAIPCSQYTYEQVISAAQADNEATPIHVISLEGSEGRNDLTALRELAEDSGGLWVIGEQVQRLQQFEQIISTLGNQWQAEAVVYPTQGPHQATLYVTLPEGIVLAAGPTPFHAEKDYVAPDQPPTVALDGFGYIGSDNKYQLRLAYTNRERLAGLRVSIWSDDGIQVVDEMVAAPAENEPIPLDGTTLVAGSAYLLQVSAQDVTGNWLANEEGQRVLVAHEFTHHPSQAQSTLTLSPVTLDEAAGMLLLEPNSTSSTTITDYEVVLVAKETNTLALETRLDRPADGILRIPLAGLANQGYTILLTGLDAAGQPVAQTSYADWLYQPHKPGIGERMQNGLRNNTAVRVLILLIIVGVVAWLIVRMVLQWRETGVPFLGRRGSRTPGVGGGR